MLPYRSIRSPIKNGLLGSTYCYCHKRRRFSPLPLPPREFWRASFSHNPPPSLEVARFIRGKEACSLARRGLLIARKRSCVKFKKILRKLCSSSILKVSRESFFRVENRLSTLARRKKRTEQVNLYLLSRPTSNSNCDSCAKIIDLFILNYHRVSRSSFRSTC